LTQNEKSDILVDLYRDILLFCKTVLPAHFPVNSPSFHKEVSELLQQKHRLNLVVAPRDHAKSTLITLGFVLYKILFRECNFVVIISDTESQAKLFLDAVKAELEDNELIKELFGNHKGDKWGELDFVTSTGIKVICKGANQKVRGLKFRKNRPDLIVIDDLENDELVENKDRRVKLASWFYKTVLPALIQEGMMVYVGTILHYDSLLNQLTKNAKWKRLFYRAIMNDRPLWKERYSLETLDEIKQNYKNQGLLDVFYCEYMNEPISDENAIFKKAYFKYYEDDETIIKSLTKVMTVDLAISEKESADYTVIMVTGIDALNQIYVLEYVRERINPIETIDHIFKLASKWKVSKIGIEGVAYQRSLQWFVAEEMRRRNEFYMIEELKADTDKERRIRGLQPRYAIGAVFHKPFMTDLEEELLLFPKSPHDDLADALAYVPQIAFRGTGAVEIKKTETQRQEAYRLAIEGQSNDWSSY
jgi:predicted phage terminase large subunit-like protein